MKQIEENIPNLKPEEYWNAQQYADLEFRFFSGNTDRITSFNDAFKEEFNQQVVSLRASNHYSKKYQSIFFTQYLIHYFQHKDFNCNDDEINWIKQERDAIKKISLTEFSFERDTKAFMRGRLAYFMLTLAGMLYLNRNLSFNSVASAVLISAMVSELIHRRVAFDEHFGGETHYTFWALIIKTVDREIQPLLDHLDKKIKAIEAKIELSNKAGAAMKTNQK